MKKIYAGILSIVAVLAIAGASAYALFSNSVTMTGMVLGTATPSLLVSLDNANFYPAITGLGSLFAPLLPGKTDWGELYLKNSSNGTSDPVDMNLTARLTTASTDWELLKDAIQMRVCLYDATPGSHCDSANTTGYYTLNSWNANTIALPGSPLLQGAQGHYTMEFFIPSSFGNEIAGKQLTDMAFEIVGTQN